MLMIKLTENATDYLVKTKNKWMQCLTIKPEKHIVYFKINFKMMQDKIFKLPSTTNHKIRRWEVNQNSWDNWS